MRTEEWKLRVLVSSTAIELDRTKGTDIST